MKTKSYGLKPEKIPIVKSDYDDFGYGYSDYEDITDLSNYGISLIKYDWFLKKSDALGFEILNYSEKVWTGHDVIVIRSKCNN